MTVRPLRVVRADNPSPMTLDGTRTYLVGRDPVAVIDPGPADASHLDAVARAVGEARVVSILTTHAHADHAAAAAPLADRMGAPAPTAPASGETVETDAGSVVAVATPGHTPDHMAFHWPDARAVFVGDLLMGGQETTLVAAPEGDLADYLRSLKRVRSLKAAVLHPAHGPDIVDPGRTIDAYRRHRRERLARVRSALGRGAGSVSEIVDAVYGELDPALRGPAAGAIVAYLRYLAERGELGESHVWVRP